MENRRDKEERDKQVRYQDAVAFTITSGLCFEGENGK